MPGPAFHLSFIALMALAGPALCFADRGTAPLLAVWILAGVYLGRDLAILAHYNPLLVILWLAGLIAFFIPAVGPRALAALRDFADAHAPAAAIIGTAALSCAFALWVRRWSRAPA